MRIQERDIVGEKGPLAVFEIANLFAGIQRTALGAATLVVSSNDWQPRLPRILLRELVLKVQI
ncbi:hypothetical protein [Cytobacillus depressus]|uniref:hypothetical protein n=1 Tax=Cytobacillus depressus TaxID=1602942 RepID=UPI00124DBA52|nr:hypothetical protein [Cytobacillus depressus]